MKWMALVAMLCLMVPIVKSSPPEPHLKGFTPERSNWERDFEHKLIGLPQPAECDKLLRELTKNPHVAGTTANEKVARLIAEEYKKAGLEVEMPSYDVLLSYPKSARVEIVGDPYLKLGRPEEPIIRDPDTAQTDEVIPWNAYSPSCDVTGEVVYANRGSAQDYDQLAKLGIKVKGKIVLTRYFGGYRGGKLLEAEKRGVAAVLVYSDPIDDGWFKGEPYPAGPWGPESHFQRGAAVYDFLVPGDPLTPGWASTPGARRIPQSESTILPKVPMMPLSARDASEILKRLKGHSVPDNWQGVAAPLTFHTGPGPVQLHLKIENTRETRTIFNVIGSLKGTDEPDRKILLSNHHDAWVYGAVDPCSGTATLISLARALGKLAQEGWKPRRTIVFGSWDAEEYTLTGSTEWGEEHETDLLKNAVVCINVDASTSGRNFSASASPVLFEAIRDAAAAIDDPGTPGQTVADSWREFARKNAGKTNIRSYTSGESAGEELPVSILGSGSDYTVFFNRLGVPSTDLIFDGPYGVYHSVYDNYQWMATVGDPGFLYHAAMAKYAGVLALRFANADIYPFSVGVYGNELARYVEDLPKNKTSVECAKELEELRFKASQWSRESKAVQQTAEARLISGKMKPKEISEINEWLLSTERSLLDYDGLPGRPWFRHMIYAPLPSYEAETLPGIREAIEANNPVLAKQQTLRLVWKLQAAITQTAKMQK